MNQAVWLGKIQCYVCNRRQVTLAEIFSPACLNVKEFKHGTETIANAILISLGFLRTRQTLGIVYVKS